MSRLGAAPAKLFITAARRAAGTRREGVTDMDKIEIRLLDKLETTTRSTNNGTPV